LQDQQKFYTMEKTKTPVSIRIIYWLTEVSFWLVILSAAFVLAFNVLAFTPFFGNDLQLHVAFPVKFNVLDKGVLELHGKDLQVELVEASSKIHFINTPMYIARIFGTAMLLAMGFLIYIAFLFRSFIVNVKKNRVFEPSNIAYLRNISYGLFGLWLFAVIYTRIFHRIVLHSISFEQVELLEDHRRFAGLLLLSLFIWVLSHVFLVGAKMKEEQDLTI